MEGMPSRFQATGTDAAVSITRSVTHHRIGLRLRFDAGHLDASRLEEAVRLSLDAEPHLGCAFRTDEFRSYWSRLPEPGAGSVVTVVETDDPDGAMDAFQADEVPDAGPQAHVVLLRSEAADHLGIKVSHVLADGQAAKQYAYLLADIYCRLGTDPAYVPTPNLAERASGRDVWENLADDQRRNARKAKSWANPTWVVPFEGRKGEGLRYRTASLPPERFRALKAYGEQRDATVNDLMLAAVFRACVDEFDPPAGKPLSLMCTADLRRYLPAADRLPISNVSISGSLDVERVDGESFDETLPRVRGRMDAWAKTCYGAAPAANAERLTRLGYRATKALLGATLRAASRSGKTYPFLTNIGVIDESQLDFDGQIPDAGYMYGPAAIGPSVVAVVSTYRDVLTVSMGFCESDCDSRMVERVLGLTIRELNTACAQQAPPADSAHGTLD